MLLASWASAGGGPTEPAFLYRATVVKVVDGDTIDVDIDLGFYIWAKNQRIRLVGIDAPEPRGESRVEGKAATAFLKELIEGKSIILRTFKGRDGADERGSFRRWLGVIYLEGKDINQAMINAGHAVRIDE
ncbi:thermonuclease family protein [Tateyamaria sp.]